MTTSAAPRAAAREGAAAESRSHVVAEDLLDPGILDSLSKLAAKMRRTMPALQAHEPEDLVQTALELGLERLGQFEGRSSLKTWLCALARNKYIDMARRAKIRPAVLAIEDLVHREAHRRDETPELRAHSIELVAWLADEGKYQIPHGSEVLTLLINTAANWDWVSQAMTAWTGQPWTVEAVKGSVRRIKRTDRGRSLCAEIGVATDMDDEEEGS